MAAVETTIRTAPAIDELSPKRRAFNLRDSVCAGPILSEEESVKREEERVEELRKIVKAGDMEVMEQAAKVLGDSGVLANEEKGIEVSWSKEEGLFITIKESSLSYAFQLALLEFIEKQPDKIFIQKRGGEGEENEPITWYRMSFIDLLQLPQEDIPDAFIVETVERVRECLGCTCKANAAKMTALYKDNKDQYLLFDSNQACLCGIYHRKAESVMLRGKSKFNVSYVTNVQKKPEWWTGYSISDASIIYCKVFDKILERRKKTKPDLNYNYFCMRCRQVIWRMICERLGLNGTEDDDFDSHLSSYEWRERMVEQINPPPSQKENYDEEDEDDRLDANDLFVVFDHPCANICPIDVFGDDCTEHYKALGINIADIIDFCAFESEFDEWIDKVMPQLDPLLEARHKEIEAALPSSLLLNYMNTILIPVFANSDKVIARLVGDDPVGYNSCLDGVSCRMAVNRPSVTTFTRISNSILRADRRRVNFLLRKHLNTFGAFHQLIAQLRPLCSFRAYRDFRPSTAACI